HRVEAEPAASRRPGTVPRGSVLSPERRADPPSAAPRSARGHPGAHRSFPASILRAAGNADARSLTGPSARPGAARLARQRQGARERVRANRADVHLLLRADWLPAAQPDLPPPRPPAHPAAPHARPPLPP